MGGLRSYVYRYPRCATREHPREALFSISRRRPSPDLPPTIAELWDEAFNGLSDAEIFAVVDEALYRASTGNWARYGRFDFLTNTGEQFDNLKTFIVCRPDQRISILYQLPDDKLGAASCSAQSFQNTSASFVRWFDKQVRIIAPSWFPA